MIDAYAEPPSKFSPLGDESSQSRTHSLYNCEMEPIDETRTWREFSSSASTEGFNRWIYQEHTSNTPQSIVVRNSQVQSDDVSQTIVQVFDAILFHDGADGTEKSGPLSFEVKPTFSKKALKRS